jgi:hypothetical protein
MARGQAPLTVPEIRQVFPSGSPAPNACLFLFFKDRGPTEDDLKAQVAGRYQVDPSAISIFQGHANLVQNAQKEAPVVSYRLDAGTPLTFLDSRSNLKFTFPFPSSHTCLHVRRFLATSYALCKPEAIVLRVGDRIIGNSEPVPLIDKICEVNIQAESPLWICFRIEAPISVPMTLSFAPDARVDVAAQRFSTMMNTSRYFIKFSCDGGKILSLTDRLSDYRTRQIYVKPVCAIVFFRYAKGRELLSRSIHCSGSPTLRMELRTLAPAWGFERDWQFDIHFGNQLFTDLDMNLAVLESSSQNPINLVPRSKITWEFRGVQKHIWVPRSWVFAELLREIKRDEGRAAALQDPSDKSIFADDDPIIAYFGKTVSVSSLLVIFHEWKWVPTFKYATIGEAIDGIISHFPAKLRGVSGSLWTQSRRFQEGDEATVLDGEVFFIIQGQTYPCTVDLGDRQWTEQLTADKTVGDVRARLKAIGSDVPALAFEEEFLGDGMILAAHLFQHKEPLSVAVIRVNCRLVVGGMQFQIECDRCQSVAELRRKIQTRFQFTAGDFTLQLGGMTLTKESDLRKVRNFSTFPLSTVCEGEVSQLLTFLEQGDARLTRQLVLPLAATMDDVVRLLRQQRVGTCVGLPQKALNEIPIPSAPIPFAFQAPVVNSVRVVLALPPNDVVHKTDFPETSTIGNLLEYAKQQFPADPAKMYGARNDDEFDDDNWWPPETLLAALENPAYLWIREIPGRKSPSWYGSTRQPLVPLALHASMSSATRGGASVRTRTSARRSGLSSPRGPPIIKPAPGGGRPATPMKQEPPNLQRGEPKGHDYGARLNELVFRSGKEQEECAQCFNFFKYNFDDALEALTAS